jgi:hypothetical protein
MITKINGICFFSDFLIDAAAATETATENTEPVTDADVDTHGLGNKNPVMMLYEFCAKKNWKVSVQMDDKPNDDG